MHKIFKNALLKEDRNRLIYEILLFSILTIGVIMRLILLTSYPQGFNVDEAYAGYEGYSLLNYGMDSHGYHFPVYFVSWGSGMNVLYSYLCIPFIKVFGLTPFATRLPQALMGIITLFVFYKLAEKVTASKRLILLSTLLLAVNPWHIMMSRWGLESNLVVSFLILGVYFWILGLDNKKFLPLSALCYGLSLYCYATIWMVVPVLLVLQIAYGVYIKKIQLNRYTVLSGAIVFIFAVPLILFLCVNMNLINEIKTPFFSIPKLISMRSDELAKTPRETLSRIYSFFRLLVTQDDGLGHSALPDFGLYYKFSLPFIVVGFVCIVKRVYKSILKKEYSILTFVLIQLIACLPIVLLISVNANKINCVHIPLIACCIYGIYSIGKYVWGNIPLIASFAYIFSFTAFSGAYFNSSVPDGLFIKGYGSAIQYAQEISNNQKIICTDIRYPNLLYVTKTPVPEFVNTVEYTNYPSAFLEAGSFSNYVLRIDPNNIRNDYIYVFSKSNTSLKDILTKKNFQIKEMDDYIVAEH